jgi:hypothetical protein
MGLAGFEQPAAAVSSNRSISETLAERTTA